jgi:hypothetical protein
MGLTLWFGERVGVSPFLSLLDADDDVWDVSDASC